ncbi:LacI family DNA-binding transcriptional regulator [Kiritimatiellaeota bacterium B1221]|nr:LacI family DNA-binding transcriptional regulator [Kiritimatiellaeota bacterium B1221]
MRPTMKMIAQKMGVSTMTVSLALKEHPRISVETREEVKRVAEEMGYRTNPMVSSLMAHIRSSRPVPYQANLAFLSDFESRDSWKDRAFIRNAYDGMCERAKEQGFLIDDFWINEKGMQGGRLEKILKSRNIQGVILSPLAESGSLDYLDWTQWSSAALGDSLLSPRLHRVTHHQTHGMELLMEHLTGKGYRRIGLAIDQLSDTKVGHAWSSYMAGHLLRIPAKQRVPIFMTSESSREESLEKFTRWFERYQPDVLVGHDNQLDLVKGLGIQVPGDVSFVHLSLPSKLYPNSEISFSGLDQNWTQIGAAAVDLVVAQIYRNERGIPEIPKTILLEGSWVEGETTPGFTAK